MALVNTPSGFPQTTPPQILAEAQESNSSLKELYSDARREFVKMFQFTNQANDYDTKASKAKTTAKLFRSEIDPDGVRKMGYWTALIGAIILSLLDVVPLYWAASTFGLDIVSTIILTVILVAAAGGGMFLLESFHNRDKTKAFQMTKIVLMAAFVGLVALRYYFLVVVSGGGIFASALEAIALSSITAGLVVVGYVLMAHASTKKMAKLDSQANKFESLAQSFHQRATKAKEAGETKEVALESELDTWLLAHYPNELSQVKGWIGGELRKNN